jgi:hypothetical protein
MCRRRSHGINELVMTDAGHMLCVFLKARLTEMPLENALWSAQRSDESDLQTHGGTAEPA